MSMTSLPFVDLEPTVVLGDASPLLHLAAVNRLDLLLAFGRVVVVDVVRLETSFDPGKPYAKEIQDWIDRNKTPIDNRYVEVAETDLGPAYEQALKSGVKVPRNSGERAIVDWLAENIVVVGGPALVVYENGKIPNMLRREGLPEDVVVVTTRYFLRLAEQRGLIDDAERLWRTIQTGDHRANPMAEATLIQKTR